MATQIIRANGMFTVDVTVCESDKYTGLAFVKFEKNYHPESVHGCSELFLTPIQLELLGKFLIRQADEIRTEQAVRS